MDRSRRAMNPGKYNEDGTIKKGKKKCNVIKLRNDGFEGNTKNVLLFFLWKI